MPSSPELDVTVMDGLQQVIQDKHEAILSEKIARREVACLKKQLEAAEERVDVLEKKVVSSNSFNKRYNVYKEEAEKVLKKDKAEEIRQKARADAYTYQKAFVSKFEEDQEEFKSTQEALRTKFKEESASIKKKATSTITVNGVQMPNLAGKKGGKKDSGEKVKRSVIPSAYSRFVGDKKPGGVKEMHDKGLADGSITEKNLFAYAGTVWKEMTDEQKKPYVDAQKADKAAKDAAKAAANGGSVSGKRKKDDSDDDEVNGAAGGGSDDDDDDAPPRKKPAKSSKGASSSKSSANGKGPKQTKLQVVTSKPAAKEDSEDEVQEGSDDDEKKGEDSDEDEAPAAEDSENDED